MAVNMSSTVVVGWWVTTTVFEATLQLMFSTPFFQEYESHQCVSVVHLAGGDQKQ
jgi:hypothetical protein